MSESIEQIDPMQENRRLRAAMDGMRSKQSLARGGVVAAVMLFLFGRRFREMLPFSAAGTLEITLGSIGLVVVAVTAIPFLRSPCPKCKRPYHSLASLVRSADDPAPCKHCGFQINKHVSRYS